MPRDVQDWTGQRSVQIVSVTGQPLGDSGAPVLAVDALVETCVSPGGAFRAAGVLASLQPQGSSSIALVGVVGAFTVGGKNSCSPAFGQATTAGNCLVAWVSANSPNDVTTVAPGWVEVVSGQSLGLRFASIWIRPNCGAAEAAPVFTTSLGNEPLIAQLAEFSGVAVAAPQDQSVAGLANGPVASLTNPAADVGFGDLILSATRYGLASAALASFADAYSNQTTPVRAGDTGATSAAYQSAFNYGIVPMGQVSIPLAVQLAGPGSALADLAVDHYPVLIQEDAEGLNNWYPGGGGTVQIVGSAAHRGTHAVQVTSTAGLNNLSTASYNGPFYNGKWRFSGWVYHADANLDHWEVQVTKVDGSIYVDFIVRYSPQTGVWSYKISDGPATFQAIKTMKVPQTSWNYLEFAGDFVSRKFLSLRIGAAPVPVVGFLGTTGASASRASIQLSVNIQNNAAAAVSVNYDDFLLVGLDA